MTKDVKGVPEDVSEALSKLGIALPEPISEDELRESLDRPTPVEIEQALSDTPIGEWQPFGSAVKADLDEGVNPKDLVGATKPDVSLVPPAGILWEAQAMMDGARKYGPYNWRENKVLARVYVAAAIRHLYQYLDGEDVDPISQAKHIGHARACLGIIADATVTGNLKDDRPKPGAAGDMIRHFGDHGSYA
ncbi:MAG: dATP/dGTP diphosphohydrolase domain-containing protein [Sphingomonas sp.]|uniref:dATP/dGTP diphosphohydrolase domain-containing protein n=1 Tax=Sphingomonas sp. TaxID=28214 RepID=UPI003F80CA4B